MPVVDWQSWLNNIVGWVQFWFVPRLARSLLILVAAYFLSRWLESRWTAWLRPTLVTVRDRDAAQVVWRRVRLTSLPTILTRALLGVAAAWLVGEQFGVPREILVWGLSVLVVGFFWTARHLLADLAAGYALTLDDALMEGDHVAASFGEGTVERVTWFAVHLRASDGTNLIVPHRMVRCTPLKVKRATKATLHVRH